MKFLCRYCVWSFLRPHGDIKKVDCHKAFDVEEAMKGQCPGYNERSEPNEDIPPDCPNPPGVMESTGKVRLVIQEVSVSYEEKRSIPGEYGNISQRVSITAIGEPLDQHYPDPAVVIDVLSQMAKAGVFRSLAGRFQELAEESAPFVKPTSIVDLVGDQQLLADFSNACDDDQDDDPGDEGGF